MVGWCAPGGPPRRHGSFRQFGGLRRLAPSSPFPLRPLRRVGATRSVVAFSLAFPCVGSPAKVIMAGRGCWTRRPPGRERGRFSDIGADVDHRNERRLQSSRNGRGRSAAGSHSGPGKPRLTCRSRTGSRRHCDGAHCLQLHRCTIRSGGDGLLLEHRLLVGGKLRLGAVVWQRRLVRTSKHRTDARSSFGHRHRPRRSRLLRALPLGRGVQLRDLDVARLPLCGTEGTPGLLGSRYRHHRHRLLRGDCSGQRVRLRRSSVARIAGCSGGSPRCTDLHRHHVSRWGLLAGGFRRWSVLLCSAVLRIGRGGGELHLGHVYRRPLRGAPRCYRVPRCGTSGSQGVDHELGLRRPSCTRTWLQLFLFHISGTRAGDGNRSRGRKR